MKIRTLLVLFLFVSVAINAQNLLTNPGFESGASVGYATSGAGYSYLSSPYSGTTLPGNYTVTNFPSSVNTTDFIFEGDHTTGVGKMLIIDGNTTPGNPKFWSAGASGAGISGLTIGTTYTFSYWIKSISNLVTDPTTQANIDIQITGGNSVTLVSGATLAPLPALSWRHVVYSFVATATTVNIDMWNTNINSVGNDFAIDDLVLTDDLIATCNVVNAACVTANDGALTVAGIGGTLPYVNYSITGPVTQNNATGIFTNLPPGTYTVTVTDSSLPTAQTATLNNIVVGPALTASPNSSICIGNSFNLNASGSSAGYTWTASPADPSLTTPNIANPTVTPAVTTTYTVSSTIGACAPITKNVIITVNPLPTVNVALPNQTICPGNAASIALTGTPNSNVTIVNDLGITYVANIGPAGTGTFVTPILQTTRVYTIVSIKNFFTQCERTGLSIIMTITVVPNGCATVKTEPAPGTPPLDLTLCTSGECRTLQAEISDVPSTTTYSVSSIPYCPYPFTDPSYNVVPITAGDDFWSPLVNLPFSFCFYGQNYNSCTIGTNGLITFRSVTAGGFCDWPDTSVAIGSVTNQSQSIFGVFQDTDMSIPPTAADGSVNWTLEGTYPCRKLIVNFYNLGQWNSTASNPGLQTSQIVLYEVSNIIEVFVQRRVAGTPWSGTGLIGVIGSSGAQSLAAPGRDAGNWSATNEAWRFTPTGPNVPVNITWLNGPTVVGTGPTVTVCPTTTTTYTLQAQYQVCGVPQTASSTVTLNVNPDLTQDPIDLTQCSDIFDLTYNLGQVLGSLDPSEYEITFHHSQLDAETLNDEITNPTTYTGVNGETIYMGIYLPSFGCTVVKSFQLFFNNCNPTPTTPPDLTLCESGYGIGTSDFDFTPQVGIAYGSYSPSDYTLTFHTSMADATNGVGAISPINTFTGTDGQIIYIRLEDNTDSTIYGTAQFTLHVNPLPTVSISGTTTICSGDTAQICFVGTPDATVSYTGPSGASTIVLDNTGNACITTPALTSTSTYTLTSVTNTTTTCSQNISGNAVVTVRQLPTATISGTVSVCQNAASPLITFTGANGTAPYTFTYTDPSGATQTKTTTSGNSVTLSVSTAIAGTYTYTLVSVQSSGTPACSQNQSGTATVTVLELPTATITGTQAVCVGDTAQVVLTGSGGTSPYTFTYSLNSVLQPTVVSTGSSYVINVPTSAPGTFAYALTDVQSSSTPACSQAQTGTATVTVNDAPVINTPTVYEVCDDNNDGFSCLFNLTSKNSEITLDPTVVITYHETLTDAQTGSNPKSSPYCNINPGTQTLYVRAYYTGSTTCYATTTLQLIVHPRPLPNPVITDYELCDYNNPGDQEEVFTLNTKDTEIANGQTGVTIAYYLTQSDAQNQVSPLANNYTNISNPQEVWINISDNGTGCNSVGSFNLVVNPLPQANLPLPIFECSNGAVTTAVFDLTTNQNVITGGLSGMNVTFYHTLADAQTPIGEINTPLTYTGNDNETVYVRVEDTSTGCYSITTQLLRVTQGPTAVTPLPLEYCDPNNDGFGIFNLEDATNAIAGGSLPAGVTVTYHETPTDALLGSNPLTSPYVNIDPWTQTIYVKVFYTTTGCSNYVELQLQVHPTPEAIEPEDLHLCDYNGAVGYESFDLTQLIPTVLGSMSALDYTVSFYTSATEAQQGTNSITNVSGYTNGVINQQTIYIRVENNTTGCYDVVSVDLIVDPLPNSLQPSYLPYSLCDEDQSSIGYETFDLESKVDYILLGQTGMSVTFYPSLTDAQNNTNAISNLDYINTVQYVQTLGIRITNDLTGCYIISTMDIRVEPLPEPVPPTTPYVVCDDNQDGFAQFDLSTLTSAILQGENYLISYHETQTDAEEGNNALPLNYININPFVQYLYVRAEDPDTHCVQVIMIELNVDPSPVAPINLENITLCDDQDSNTQNGTRLVDLTQRTPDVLAQQPLAASNYEVTYYTSEAEANLGTMPITPATAYMGSDGETIWVRVENLTTGCYNLGTFQLEIGIPLLVATPQPINECDNDANPNDQHTTFDLTVREITPLAGYTIRYYPSLAEAYNDANEIMDPTAYVNVPAAVQTLGVAIISAEGCKSYTTLNIRVLPVPTPNTAPSTLPALCEETTGSGQAHVDLTQNASYIINSDPNVVLHYFNSMADLESNTNEITNPSNALVGDVSIAGQTINQIQYVYIAVSSTVNSDYTNRPCYVVVPQGYIINPLPQVKQNHVYQECEADPSGINDGITQFNLESQTAALNVSLPTTPSSTYSIAFYEGPGATNMIATPSNYTNTSNPQTIYVVITNTITGCQSEVGQFELVVNPKPTIAYTMLDFESCDDDGVNDGMMFYENNSLGLADYIDDLLVPTQPDTDYTVEFYTNQADAEAGNSANAIQNLDTYQVQTGTYWIRIENNTTGCYNIDSFEVLIEKLAEPLIESNTGSNIACVNWNTTLVQNNLILDSQVTGDYTFEWYADGVLIPGETSSTLAITDMSEEDVKYSVIAVSNSSLGCRSAEVDFTVVRSGQAANLSYTVTNAFSENQIITVTYDGYGIYHYSLDDGPILDNGGVFTNVPFGEHTVYVWDVRDPNGYSCGVVAITGVQVIDYPHYFTPNGDGIHDTWNIVGLSNQPSAKIYIFDRYGKLLKQISSESSGWDGTFNGALMPSTDYWFLVEYEEQGQIKEFKAHFSLKR